MTEEGTKIRSKVPKWFRGRLHRGWRIWYDRIRPKANLVFRILLWVSMALFIYHYWPYISALPAPLNVVPVYRVSSSPHRIPSSFVSSGNLELVLDVPEIAATRSKVSIAYHLTSESPPDTVITGTITMSSENQPAHANLPSLSFGPITTQRDVQEYGEYEFELSDDIEGNKLQLEVILELSDGIKPIPEIDKGMHIDIRVVNWPLQVIPILLLGAAIFSANPTGILKWLIGRRSE